jgi:hypothetical protein
MDQGEPTMLRVIVVTSALALLTSAVWAGEPPTAKESAKSPDALKAEIEALMPAKLAWKEIQWKTCLLEGLKEAREKKKPILLWVVGPGEALEGRC